MTRPMPEPPDWYDIDWNPVWGMVWIKNGDECDEMFNHAELDKKRLTMEGCAAHYHQADADYQTERLAEISMRLRNLQRTMLDELPAAPLTVSETRTQARHYWETWHRFATHPHTLEES